MKKEEILPIVHNGKQESAGEFTFSEVFFLKSFGPWKKDSYLKWIKINFNHCTIVDSNRRCGSFKLNISSYSYDEQKNEKNA